MQHVATFLISQDVVTHKPLWVLPQYFAAFSFGLCFRWPFVFGEYGAGFPFIPASSELGIEMRNLERGKYGSNPVNCLVLGFVGRAVQVGRWKVHLQCHFLPCLMKQVGGTQVSAFNGMRIRRSSLQAKHQYSTR